MGTKFMHHPGDRAETSLEVFVPAYLGGAEVGVLQLYQGPARRRRQQLTGMGGHR